MCSSQGSTAHTSWPADASSPAYTEPIAPQPTIATFTDVRGCAPDPIRVGRAGARAPVCSARPLA